MVVLAARAETLLLTIPSMRHLTLDNENHFPGDRQRCILLRQRGVGMLLRLSSFAHKKKSSWLWLMVRKGSTLSTGRKTIT